MEHLPSDDEQRWLVHGLYDLIERRGAEPFVAALILEPTSEFFPDRWEPNERGVRTLLLRLLAYAGLDALKVDVHLFEDPARPGATWDAPTRHRGVAGWFAGIEDGVCRFGIDAHQIGDPEALTGVLCHEVAHAYRAHHALAVDDRGEEEKLTDLTTIYLGFGVFTVNNTDRHRAHGSGGYRTVTQASAGYLSPQAMSFLFAAQLVARRPGARERRRLTGLLEANQAAFFDAAWEKLGADPDKLGRRLGLPAELPGPRPREAVRPLRDEGDEGDEEGDGARDDRERDRPVLRVKRRTRAPYVVAGVALGIILALLLGDAGLKGGPVLFAMAAAVAAGISLGRWARRDRCSGCHAALPERFVAACPSCERAVAGVVDAWGKPIEAPPAPAREAAREDAREAPEGGKELSEMDAHIVRLRAEPAVARMREEGDEVALHRALRARRAKAKSPAEEAAFDWILRDPRPRLDTRARRPWIGALLGTGTMLDDDGLHDPEDGSWVAILWFHLLGVPITPLARYVVRRDRGAILSLGRAPLGLIHRGWRGLVVLLLLSPLIWIGPAVIEARRGKVHLVNGLDVPVMISIGGERIKVHSGAREERVLPRGRYHAKVVGEDGRAIDEQDLTVPGGGSFVAYNVLGAALLFAHEVVYSQSSVAKPQAAVQRYVNRKLVERDDVEFAFVDPPLSLKGSEERRFQAVSLLPGGWQAAAAVLADEGSRGALVELTAHVSLAEPFDRRAVAMAANAALAQGGIDQALAHLARLIERAPLSEPAHMERQWLLRRAGRAAEAREIYRRMHKEQPESALAAFLRARVEPSGERLRLLPDLVRAHPSSASLHALFGRTLLGAGRYADTIVELTRAAELAPREQDAWIELHARALVALGRTADATALVASRASVKPDGPIALLYGRLARLDGARAPHPPDHFFEALAAAKALAEATADLRAHYRVKVGDLEGAKEMLPAMKSREARAVVEIELAAASDPARAARLLADAPHPPSAAIFPIDDALLLLLASELVRSRDVAGAERILAELRQVEDAVPLAARVLGRPGDLSDLDLGDLPLDVRAALRFADARQRGDHGASGAELAEARREALALEVLRGPVTRAVAAWPP